MRHLACINSGRLDLCTLYDNDCYTHKSTMTPMDILTFAELVSSRLFTFRRLTFSCIYSGFVSNSSPANAKHGFEPAMTCDATFGNSFMPLKRSTCITHNIAGCFKTSSSKWKRKDFPSKVLNGSSNSNDKQRNAVFGSRNWLHKAQLAPQRPIL